MKGTAHASASLGASETARASRSARTTLTALTAGIVLLGGCGKKADTSTDLPTAIAAPAADAAPLDHLAPGELVEGTEKAFGLTLPRDLAIDRRYHDLVYARGPMKMDLLQNYFEARVREGTVQKDITGTTFENVRAVGETTFRVRIRIHPDTASMGSIVEVRDITPPPLEPLPDEAARWRSVGMTPNGQLVDPKHLH